MTKSPRKNVPDVGIELGAACMPSELASDRATAPGSPDSEQASSTSSASNFDIVAFMKSDISVLKSDLSAELNQSLDNRFDALVLK